VAQYVSNDAEKEYVADAALAELLNVHRDLDGSLLGDD
jgi:hypothetical protein